MIADTLLNWDKNELANILAEKMADAEDLIEALPSIEIIGTLEESILGDYIESNWKLILSCFDMDELTEWIEEKDYEEEWERWRNKIAEEEYEYCERRLDEYCWKVIEMADNFHYKDLAEKWGYHKRKKQS